MSILELRRVSPLRFANITAAVSFIVYGALTLLLAPFFLIVFTLLPHVAPPAGPTGMPFPGPGSFLGLLIFYPILGAIMGWIFGGVAALAFNLVVRMTGGLQLEFDTPALAEPIA